jgi:ribonuclease HI
MIIFLLWHVWHHRNNVVHGDGKASITASTSFISNYYQSFLAVTKPNLVGNYKTEGPSTWAAPSEGMIKANVDAGWDSVSKSAGIGIVIRDHSGQPVLSEWTYIPSCASADDAEIQACLQGLKHLIALRWWPVTLECDCLRAVQTRSSRGREFSCSWALIQEARDLLELYRDIDIRKVDRANNGVAHVFA